LANGLRQAIRLAGFEREARTGIVAVEARNRQLVSIAKIVIMPHPFSMSDVFVHSGYTT
jgi:hypothetical protein